MLAGDLWEECINREPARFLTDIVRQKPTKDGETFTGKQISVEELAKYDFNISRHMGTFLKKKFDFTGVAGIEKAYKALFRIESIFDEGLRERLFLVEQYRHLIIHKAGVVDHDFLRKTGLDLKLGEKLCITEPEVSSAKIDVISACGTILLRANKIFSEVPDSAIVEYSPLGDIRAVL